MIYSNHWNATDLPKAELAGGSLLHPSPDLIATIVHTQKAFEWKVTPAGSHAAGAITKAAAVKPWKAVCHAV